MIKQAVAIDVDSSPNFMSWQCGYTHCLTASRGKTSGFYITSHGRKNSLDEMMKLQGMSPKDLKGWKSYMARGSMNHALGNAMSGNILQRVLPRALTAGGLARPVPDRWLDKSYRFWA